MRIDNRRPAIWRAPAGAVFALLVAMALSLAASGGVMAAGGEVLHPLGADVALRAAPSATAQVLRRLGPGDRLLLYERRGEWLRVGLFGAVGVEGWVDRAEVAPARAPPRPAEKPERPPPPPPLPVFLLEIDGRPALKFSGECLSLGRDGAIARRAFTDLVPKSYQLNASAVSCRVEKEDFLGRLRVSLRRQGDIVASAQTTAPLNWVVVRSDGPWGEAAGWRGRRGLIVPQP